MVTIFLRYGYLILLRYPNAFYCVGFYLNSYLAEPIWFRGKRCCIFRFNSHTNSFSTIVVSYHFDIVLHPIYAKPFVWKCIIYTFLRNINRFFRIYPSNTNATCCFRFGTNASVFGREVSPPRMCFLRNVFDHLRLLPSRVL